MLPVIISVRPLKGEEQNKEAGNITLPASSLNPFFYHYQRKIVLFENFICMAILVFYDKYAVLRIGYALSRQIEIFSRFVTAVVFSSVYSRCLFLYQVYGRRIFHGTVGGIVGIIVGKCSHNLHVVLLPLLVDVEGV